jgi:hypothetical protein
MFTLFGLVSMYSTCPCFLLEYQAILCVFLQKFNEEHNVFFIEKGSIRFGNN